MAEANVIELIEQTVFKRQYTRAVVTRFDNVGPGQGLTVRFDLFADVVETPSGDRFCRAIGADIAHLIPIGDDAINRKGRHIQ